EQGAGLVEQPVVDGPGVDAGRGYVTGLPQAFPRLAEQVDDVPVQPVRERHRLVVEPVDLGQLHSGRTDPADDDPAAGRAEVDGGALGAPAPGEDPGAADHAVGVDAVDPDAVLAEFGGQQPHLVGLVGLGRAVRDVVRPGEQAVLAGDVDDVAAHRLVDQDPG